MTSTAKPAGKARSQHGAKRLPASEIEHDGRRWAIGQPVSLTTFGRYGPRSRAGKIAGFATTAGTPGGGVYVDVTDDTGATFRGRVGRLEPAGEGAAAGA